MNKTKAEIIISTTYNLAQKMAQIQYTIYIHKYKI